VAALGLHLAGFAFVPVAGGSPSAGNGGTAALTLAASDAGVAAMVATWDAPPAVSDAPPAPTMTGDAPPVAMPLADFAPALPKAEVPLSPIMAEPAPFIDAPPPPLPTLRPKARPVLRVADTPPADPPAQSAPVTQPKPAGSGTAAQVATGSGGGTQAGDAGQASAAGVSGAAVADLKAEWGAGIRARIERKKRYPAGTTATGAVKLRLTVGADGQLQGLSVLQSSGDAALDAAAVKAVKAAGRFARAPKGVKGTATFTFNVRFER
jgi:periplasmic protein TonB